MNATGINLGFEGFPTDCVRTFVYGDNLPQDRAGYILAGYARDLFVRNSLNAPEYVNLALRQLTDEATADLHQPPLSAELSELSLSYLEDIDAVERHLPERKSKGEVTLMLLAMIIDHGTKPTETYGD